MPLSTANSSEIADIYFRPIGIIHSAFTDLKEMPIQPAGRASAPGSAEIFPAYQEGLKDLEGFSHVILLYHLHKAARIDLTVTPFLDQEPRGIFATRAPTRPNPIGLSVVRVTGIREGVIQLANVDILNGTPLLDVKPYVPEFDQPEGPVETGWLAAARGRVQEIQSDARFT